MQIARFRSLHRRGMRLTGVTHASDGPGEPLARRTTAKRDGGARVGGRVAGKRGVKGSAAISRDPRYWHLAVPASMTSASPEAETLAALHS